MKNVTNVEYGIKKNGKQKNASLSMFEKVVRTHPKINKELAEQIFKFQNQKFKKFPKEKLYFMGFDEKEVQKIDGELPEVDLGLYLFPRWIVEFLRDYWRVYDPIYVINFENNSIYSHDYIVSYETDSGLIDLKQTTAAAWSTGSIHCAPCWDMLRYAWAVWNPDDNVEILRVPQKTIEEINLGESPVKACVDTYAVRIDY